MDSKIYFVMVLVLCGISQVVFADDAGISKQFSVCMDKSGSVDMNMVDCIGAETKRQDIRLNKAYKEIMAQLEPARKKELQDVQRVWIKFRDGNCNFRDDGGTLGRVLSNSCFMNATASRATELEGFKE